MTALTELTETESDTAESFTQTVEKIEANLASVIRGKPDSIRLLLLALLAGGHALLEDVPGTGKTTLAKSLARSMDGVFRRIQFTPDLLPADITGSSFYNPADGSFTFREGPVFANVVLADEINRAPAKVQSALLEVMAEFADCVQTGRTPLTDGWSGLRVLDVLEAATRSMQFAGSVVPLRDLR